MRITRLIAMAALVSASAHAQPFQLGRILSTEFLMRRVQQELMQTGVAIINENVGSLMIVDRGSSASPVVFLRGSGNFLWAQFGYQLSSAAGRGEPFHLEIERRVVVRGSCPALRDALDVFLGNLDSVLNDRGAGRTQKPEMIVDATSFRIVVPGRDARMIVVPDGPLDPPLEQATGKLHSVVSGCAGAVTPKMEQDDF